MVPQAEQPKQQKCLFSQIWGLEVQDQTIKRAGFSEGLSPWLSDTCLLIGVSLGVCAHPGSLPLLIKGPDLLD